MCNHRIPTVSGFGRSLHNIGHGGFGSIVCAFPTEAKGEILQVPEVICITAQLLR